VRLLQLAADPGLTVGAVRGLVDCPKTPRPLLELGPLARTASREQAADWERTTAELARYKLGRHTSDDQDGYHRVQCPAAIGKIRCPLRQASMTLDRDRPESCSPPNTPRPAAHSRPSPSRQTYSPRPRKTRLPLRRLAPLLLGKISTGDRDLTHEALDELPAGKALAHLRSVLVATGALPERDEIITCLERWVAETSRAREDPGERRILHGYATWHHLRKLRQRLRGSPATYLQALNVRCHVTAAARYLDWLAGEGLTLASCRQGDVERWACSAEASYRDETAHFIRWAVEHRHARGLTAGAVRWGGPQGPHDTQKRWDDARRLLHDGTLSIQDRVAGLLLLLYAQHISTVTELTTDDVRDNGTTVSIMLGTVPVTLPEPLDGLVRELAATHRGHAAIGRPGTTPWLFPGGRPGQHIGYDSLCTRLKNIGLSPQQDRSTALFALAAELPAAILARMLGIHIAVAVQWQRAASGDWGAYAADVSRRTTRSQQ
jgi:hypothetical protein